MQPGPIKFIPLADIHARAPHRPHGYVERVMSLGAIAGDNLELPEQVFEDLRAEYAPGQAKCQGCGS